MALYNVSISVKGLKHISESPEIIPVIWTLLDGKDTLGIRYNPGIDGTGLKDLQVFCKKQKKQNKRRLKLYIPDLDK